MKELDLKLTLGMAERRLTESVVQISARPKVTLSQTSRLCIDMLYIAAVVIVRTINSRTKKKQVS